MMAPTSTPFVCGIWRPGRKWCVHSQRQLTRTYTQQIVMTEWNLRALLDVVVDERLATKADGSGLLACAPSEDGELWVPYLEKV